MDLRAALAGVAGYSHSAGKTQAAHQHLLEVARSPVPEFPLGLRVLVSGKSYSLPVVPWIALLDPDVTTAATDGLYPVYLFDRTVQRVYLSMNQGATQHLRQAESDGLKGKAAEESALTRIRAETVALRAGLDPSVLVGMQPDIDLGSPNFLPRGYEAGSVAAIEYTVSALPSAEVLGHDLAQFAVLYQRCVELKDQLAANQRVGTSARSEKKRAAPIPIPVFKPKDASDYVANTAAAKQKRTRTHEALIESFGIALLEAGRMPATNVHPRDLTVDDGPNHWLVEAKTVGTNAEHAVREAIGQLMAYRHFYYRVTGENDPKLLALFNAPIGPAFEELLSSLSIEVVYRDGAVWGGSAAGLALTS